MSESPSSNSHTKTTTESATSSSTENLAQDRWTNNISYSQLVASSCISILQLWWHPYIHDLQRLLPFVLLYNVFSVVLGYPLLYLELAIGAVTKQSAMKCWDMAPIGRGIGISMLLSCAITALSLGAVCAWCLALLVHSAHVFLPWLHCAAGSAPCAARHRPLPPGADTPAQSFVLNFVLHLKRDGLRGGLGSIVPELTVYHVISWMLVYLVACKRIYSYSKMVLFKDVLAFFIVTCCCVGVFRLKGAGRMFAEFRWSVLFDSFQFWREALEFSLVQLSVSQGTLIMLGAMAPRQPLGRPAALTFLASKLVCTGAALVLGAAHGALYYDYDAEPNVMKGAASSLVLWADLSARLGGSQFWAALIFLTLFTLAVSHTALLVQTLMSALTGSGVRHIRWALLVLLCAMFCFTGIMTLCTQGGIYVMDMLWWATRARPLLSACAAAVVPRAFCERVYDATGDHPPPVVRAAWVMAPPVLLLFFISSMWSGEGAAGAAGWSLVGVTLLPAAAFALLYLVFKCRVRNIVSEEK
ncbi:sodium-dependent dopamine transporter-like [Aricia agestis]|uniref:sodium-dependent dopamine transporter-like n=1 Tax=Aricia agestis TaxID=91739 RepID=UPI001C205008|nr:sodium-dependent dopamine transporter-like [Aricia agestis]